MPHPTTKTTMQALNTFCNMEGYDNHVQAMEEIMLDNPGTMNSICMNLDCTCTDEKELDSDEGWCYECNENSMKSIAVLLEII